MNILGIQLEIISILIGVGLGMLVCLIMVLIKRKLYSPQTKFVNLRKEVVEGKAGIKRALTAFENFEDVLDYVGKNIR